MGEKGFSLTELMVSLTILAVGLLALAQLQVVSMQGTSVSRQFSTATNLAREVVESAKIPGVYISTIPGTLDELEDTNSNNSEAAIAPAITKDTSIVGLEFDSIEVLEFDSNTNTFNRLCFNQDPDDCDDQVPDGDYIRIINVRNIPDGSTDDSSVMKDINVIVLWKERDLTRSVSIRTLVGKKDGDFF